MKVNNPDSGEHPSKLLIRKNRVRNPHPARSSTETLEDDKNAWPLCLHRKSMLFCRMVDLSIFLVLPGNMVPSSLMRTLNWSLLFFSDLLRDTLQSQNRLVNEIRSAEGSERPRWHLTVAWSSPFRFVLLIFFHQPISEAAIIPIGSTHTHKTRWLSAFFVLLGVFVFRQLLSIKVFVILAVKQKIPTVDAK